MRREPIRRTITVGATVHAGAAEALAAYQTTYFGGFDPIILRHALRRLDRRNAVFGGLVPFVGAVREEVDTARGDTAAATDMDFDRERLEAHRTVGDTTYRFTVSYKHLADTYTQASRGFGQASPDDVDRNTIILESDTEVAARLRDLVDHVTTNVLLAAPAHPHAFPPGGTFVRNGMTFTVEGTRDVHVYPTAGGATLNFSNAEYRALVSYADWRADRDDAVKRGNLLARKADLSAAKVGRIFTDDIVPAQLVSAERAQWLDRARADLATLTQRITDAVARARDVIDGHDPNNFTGSRVDTTLAAVTALGEAINVVAPLQLRAHQLAPRLAGTARGLTRAQVNEELEAIRTAQEAFTQVVTERVTQYRSTERWQQSINMPAPDSDDEGGMLGGLPF